MRNTGSPPRLLEFCDSRLGIKPLVGTTFRSLKFLAANSSKPLNMNPKSRGIHSAALKFIWLNKPSFMCLCSITRNAQKNCYSTQKRMSRNCRLWLVILTAVDPSQLPRLRFIPRFILISGRVVFSAVYGMITLRDYQAQKFRSRVRGRRRSFATNNGVKVHGAARRPVAATWRV